MKKFKLADGKIYDESYFEKLSEEAARGNYPGEPEDWIVRYSVAPPQEEPAPAQHA